MYQSVIILMLISVYLPEQRDLEIPKLSHVFIDPFLNGYSNI